MATSPRRWATSSARVWTGITSTSRMRAASRALTAGTETVGMARSRARATIDAVIENLRLFVTERKGAAPTRRAYGKWPKHVVSLSTVEKRFGTWSRAVALAYAQ